MKDLSLLFISFLFLQLTTFAQWTQIGPEGGVVMCLADNGTNLFAGTSGNYESVFHSTNNGTSWTPVLYPLEGVNSITFRARISL